jgi:hypothetical protein
MDGWETVLGGLGLGLAVAAQIGPGIAADRRRWRRLVQESSKRRWELELGRRARADVDRPARRDLVPVEVLESGRAWPGSWPALEWFEDLDDKGRAS